MIVYRSPHYVWMAPVGSLTLYLPAAGLLWLAGSRWPVLRSARAACAMLVFLTVLTLLVLPGWLHEGSAVLLAAGLTMPATRYALRRWEAVLPLVRRTLPAFGATVAVIAALALGSPAVAERLAIRGLPPAQPGAPNVLFIILDTVRGGSLSLLGYDRETTPNLAWLAERGVTFERAIAPAPWTLPTHASVFTGRPPHELSAGFAIPLDDTQPTLAEVLSGNGYVTAGFVANFFNADYEHGLDRGFVHWEDYRISFGQVVYNAVLTRRFLLDGAHGRQNSRLLQVLDLDMRIGEKTADEINASALEWLSAPRDRPTFVFLNYFDAHYPYDPPEPYNARFGAADSLTRPFDARLRRALSLTRWRGESRQAERELRDLYEEEILALDAQIGGLLRQLDERGVLNRTLVVLTSDHGEAFGEHGNYEHGNGLFLTQIHVPLIIAYPDAMPRGARVSMPVGLRHLGATILDATDVTRTDSLAGSSLAQYWESPAPGPRPYVLSTLERPSEFHASLVTPRLHYLYADGTEHLYDHVRDPAELDDLVDEAWAEDTLELLRSELLLRLADEAPPEMRERLTP